MTDISRIRTGLAAALETIAPDGVTVSRGGIDGQLALPAIVIGQPKISLDDPAPCMNTIELPIAVVAARDGGSDQAVIDQLDGLLSHMISALRGLEQTNHDLGGTADSWAAARTQFGSYAFGAATLPAHLIFLTIHAR